LASSACAMIATVFEGLSGTESSFESTRSDRFFCLAFSVSANVSATSEGLSRIALALKVDGSTRSRSPSTHSEAQQLTISSEIPVPEVVAEPSSSSQSLSSAAARPRQFGNLCPSTSALKSSPNTSFSRSGFSTRRNPSNRS
jgi:hypothetical protein